MNIPSAFSSLPLLLLLFVLKIITTIIFSSASIHQVEASPASALQILSNNHPNSMGIFRPLLLLQSRGSLIVSRKKNPNSRMTTTTERRKIVKAASTVDVITPQIISLTHPTTTAKTTTKTAATISTESSTTSSNIPNNTEAEFNNNYSNSVPENYDEYNEVGGGGGEDSGQKDYSDEEEILNSKEFPLQQGMSKSPETGNSIGIIGTTTTATPRSSTPESGFTGKSPKSKNETGRTQSVNRGSDLTAAAAAKRTNQPEKTETAKKPKLPAYSRRNLNGEVVLLRVRRDIKTTPRSVSNSTGVRAGLIDYDYTVQQVTEEGAGLSAVGNSSIIISEIIEDGNAAEQEIMDGSPANASLLLEDSTTTEMNLAIVDYELTTDNVVDSGTERVPEISEMSTTVSSKPGNRPTAGDRVNNAIKYKQPYLVGEWKPLIDLNSPLGIYHPVQLMYDKMYRLRKAERKLFEHQLWLEKIQARRELVLGRRRVDS